MYVADIGDNNRARPFITIYRVDIQALPARFFRDTPQQGGRCPVAFAGGRFELLAIDDGQVSPVIGDQSGLLQRPGGDGDRLARGAQHHRDKLLREREIISFHAVSSH